MKPDITRPLRELIAAIEASDPKNKIALLNDIRIELHEVSPFKTEPVDCVLWVSSEEVRANGYNPNSVAPPELKLLETSILEDGYTQPVVGWENPGFIEVVDGFHRNRICKESPVVRKRVMGFLPVVLINDERQDKSDRMAATIRHNRARGKHQVEKMADIVIELKRRNWSDDRIANNLGMDADEVLRLTQITGLADMFADQKFSEAWEHEGPAETPVLEEAEDFESFVMSKAKIEKPEGWSQLSDISHVKVSASGAYLGFAQKSRFRSEWFWYAYTIPMQEGRTENLDQAKAAIASAFDEKA